jgi:hypothetical protein
MPPANKGGNEELLLREASTGLNGKFENPN